MLEKAIEDAKAMNLDDGQSIAEELGLMEGQLAELRKAQEERKERLIKERYSSEAEHISLGEFVLTRVLNSDVESRTIWLLGRFKRDPTEN